MPDRKKSGVSVIELKRLLVEIKDLRPDICIRMRLLGQLWQTHFHRITEVRENSVILQDEKSGGFIHIDDLKTVIQFELDSPFQVYKPYIHYGVTVLNLAE